MAQCQIIKRLKGKGNKWEFVAHGARFDDTSAAQMIDLIKSHGTHIVRKLPI